MLLVFGLQFQGSAGEEGDCTRGDVATARGAAVIHAGGVIHGLGINVRAVWHG